MPASISYRRYILLWFSHFLTPRRYIFHTVQVHTVPTCHIHFQYVNCQFSVSRMFYKSYRRFSFAGSKAESLSPFSSFGRRTGVQHDITVASMHFEALYFKWLEIFLAIWQLWGHHQLYFTCFKTGNWKKACYVTHFPHFVSKCVECDNIINT